jgi:sugar phosphate permease
MSLPKEKKQARLMMHVSLIIGALCIIIFVISIAWKLWLLAPCAAICGGIQYFSYKSWQKRA